MYVHLRKCYPYYGKFKIKVCFEIPRGDHEIQKAWIERACRFFEKNIGDGNYRTTWWHVSSFWEVYIKDFEHLEIIEQTYKSQIHGIYKPAPKFEHLEGRSPKSERILYYNRFPYRVIFKLPRGGKIYELVEWCEGNSEGDYKKTGYYGNVSFFFMRATDAAVMKLTWGDYVESTHMPDSSKIEPLLRENVVKAETDLEEFLEGVKNLGI